MLLVTNDYPPKVGGIQNYLYELWSRLPYDETRVITTKYKGDKEFDAKQNHEIERFSKILWPTPKLTSHVNKTIKEMKTDVVFIDPLLPTGLISSRLIDVSKVLIIHGAEITVPGRLPVTKTLVKHVAKNVDYVLSAGTYAAKELVSSTGSSIPLFRIPPGVDTELFSFPSNIEKESARKNLVEKLNIGQDSKIVMTASRLVPRKGFDVAIKAISELKEDVHLVVVGTGRDFKRLNKIARDLNIQNRVHFLGRISQDDLVNTYHASDVFLMLCRDRWKSLEAEGFGIVFLEAQSCGLPVIVGRSGGSSESVLDSTTGYVVDPLNHLEVKDKLEGLLSDTKNAEEMGIKGRKFVEEFHSYSYLASLLTPIANGDFSQAIDFAV